MRAYLLLLRAEFGRARRRRAVFGLIVVGLSMVVISSWANLHLVPESRRNIAQIEGLMARLGLGPEAARAKVSRSAGTVSVQGFGIETEEKRIEAVEKDLGPRHSHLVVLGFLGSGPGIAVAVLLAATLFGADFRWAYWKTLALHEPRRTRVVTAKFVVLGTLLLLGLILFLAVSYATNAIFARAFEVDTVGGLPPVGEVAQALGRSWLTTAAYGTVAAMVVICARSSLAGAGAVLGLVVLDGLLTTKFFDLLHQVSPAQQVAYLFEQNPYFFGLISVIWPLRSPRAPLNTLGLSEPPGLVTHATDLTMPILTLTLLMSLSVLVAVFVMLRRDIPN